MTVNTSSDWVHTGELAKIDSLTVQNSGLGRRVRIVCKVSGQPPPKVTWFKDGRSIGRNRSKYQFVYFRYVLDTNRQSLADVFLSPHLDVSTSRTHPERKYIHTRAHRKRSELIIRSAMRNDSGKYECRAKNKMARQIVNRVTWVDVMPRTSTEVVRKYSIDDTGTITTGQRARHRRTHFSCVCASRHVPGVRAENTFADTHIYILLSAVSGLDALIC